MKIVLVNNTNIDIRSFQAELILAVSSGVLPDELQDVFNLTIIVLDDERRGILNFI